MRRLRDDQDGAVAVIVAILLVALVGMAAYAVDVGALYQERRELQNGADAAGLAAAMDCADVASIVACVETSVELNDRIDEYANANANDGASEAYIIELTASSITVETETVSGGNGFLTHFFAGVLGQASSTVRARATARWGPLGGTVNVIPLGICEKEFDRLTTGGTVFSSGVEEVRYGTDVCDFQSDGGDTYEGGYAWLTVANPSTCQMEVSDDQWWLGQNGGGAPTAMYGTCLDILEQAISDASPDGATFFIPIYSDFCKPNNSPCGSGEHRFFVKGFAAFSFYGFNFPGKRTYNPCMDGQPHSCIKGHFVEYVDYGDIDPAAHSFGVTAVELAR